MTPDSWATDGRRVRILPGVHATFQRVPQSPDSGGEESLRSHGAALVAAAGAALLLPVGTGEAFWIGLEAERGALAAVRVGIRSAGGARLDALTGAAWLDRLEDSPQNYAVCPPRRSIDGLYRNGRVLPFARLTDAPERYAPCDVLELAVHRPTSAGWEDDPAVRLTVRLVTFEEFRDATGQDVAPIDPHDAYRGWRLP